MTTATPVTPHVLDTVTFHNVTIVIAGARDPVDAYNRLCKALATMEGELGLHIDWKTDTYATTFADGVNPPPSATRDLFPESRRRDADSDQ